MAAPAPTNPKKSPPQAAAPIPDGHLPQGVDGVPDLDLGGGSFRAKGCLVLPLHDVDLKATPPGGHLLATLLGRLRNNGTLAFYDAAARTHRVSAQTYRLHPSGVSRPAALHTSRVLSSIVGNEVGLFTTISWGASLALDTYSEAGFDAYMPRGTAEDRQIAPQLATTLNCVQADVRPLGTHIKDNRTCYDCTAFYAKGAYLLLAMELWTIYNPAQGLNWVGPANQNPIRWIDLSAPAFPLVLVTNSMKDASISLIENVDYFNEDAVDFLQCVAAEGTEFIPSFANATHHPAGLYYEWPAIEMTILARRIDPGARAGGPIDIGVGWNTLKTIAQSLEEEDQYHQGILLAIELLTSDWGVLRGGQTVAAQRLAHGVGGANAIPTLLKPARLGIQAMAAIPNAHANSVIYIPIQPSSYSSLQMKLHQPRGHNWAPRALRIERGRQMELGLVDTTEIMGLPTAQRWAVFALQAYVERGAAACALFSFSLTGADLQRYYNQIPGPAPDALVSLATMDCLLWHAKADRRIVLWRLIQYVLSTCVGGRIQIGPLQEMRSWSDVTNFRHDFPGPYLPWDTVTPMLSNPMPLLALFEPRPLELGITNCYAEANFNDGIVLTGADANALGWRSYLHDKNGYTRSAVGKEGLYVATGLIGFNCAKMISEPFDVPVGPRPAIGLTLQPILDNDNEATIVNEPIMPPPAVIVPVFDVPMRVLRPFTCRTYDWNTATAYAPTISNQQFGSTAVIQALSMIPKGPRPDIGVTSYSPSSRLGAPSRRDKRSRAFDGDDDYAKELAAKRQRLPDGTVAGN